MLRRYGTVLRTPGVPRLAASFLALGLAGTMTPVAFVLFARASTRSYATASLVLAASTAGGLLLGPARGRLVDRLGARDAVLLLVVPDIATDLGFIVAARERIGAGALIALALLGGAVSAPASAAFRSVWSETLSRTDSQQAGYSLMAIMQETNFILGPLVAGLLIGLFSTTTAVVAIAGLSFVGAVAFAVGQQSGERRAKPAAATRFAALSGGGMQTVLATASAFGLTFGMLDVAFPAFARSHGAPAVAGILLSAFALGSWIGAFLYGLRPQPASAARRYPRVCLLAALGLAPLILTPSLPVMAALAAISGLCFAPITTCQIAVIDEVASSAHKSEAFSWLGTLYGSGLALGAAVAGQLVSAGGPRAALVGACGATAVAWLLAAVRAPAVAERAPAG